jgi:hypothetical protein
MSAAGHWTIAIPALGKKFDLKLASPKTGVLTGTIAEITDPPPTPVAISNGKEDGAHFNFDTPAVGQAPAARFDGTVNGASMSGKVSGALPFNGSRV